MLRSTSVAFIHGCDDLPHHGLCSFGRSARFAEVPVDGQKGEAVDDGPPADNIRFADGLGLPALQALEEHVADELISGKRGASELSMLHARLDAVTDHHAETRGVVDGEKNVRDAHILGPKARHGGGLLCRRAQRCLEEPEALFGNRRQERVFIFEMVIGGTGAHPSGPSRRAEREALRSTLFDEAKRRIEQCPPEIAVVVRLFGGWLTSRFFGSTHSVAKKRLSR